MWGTPYRSPWPVVHRRRPFLQIAELVWASWPTLGGLFLAFGLTPLMPAHRLANFDDPFQHVAVKSDEVHRIHYLEEGSELPDGANLGEDRFHLCGLFTGRVTGDELEAPIRKLEMLHGVEMIVDCRHKGVSGSCFVDHLHFERIWEASIVSSSAPVGLTLPQGEECLFLGPQESAPHLGQRPIPAAKIAERFRGLERLSDEELNESFGLWCVSSLSGKTVRIESLVTGRVASIQPLGCDLSKGELDWLKASVLPSLMHPDNNGTCLSGAEVVLPDLSRVLPFDACAAVRFNNSDFRDRLVQRSQQRLAISWIAPPDFFANLYSPHAFVDPELGFWAGSARLACSLR